ncbi:carbonic anhydrase 7-like [Homarus americanus]|uniref:carbonic anhydrase 7-like n=1 Tax=Homarus americanus TaxID=6706 RepID=UPI001C447B87|nr:carbonic anhydrase 7-like [Homarus americanus]XP_042241759.1 carbonic anhydrase 7-like [Homarus americanus]
MTNLTSILSLLLLVVRTVEPAQSQLLRVLELPPSPQWSYDDVKSWSKVAPQCLGSKQSPVDFTKVKEFTPAPFVFTNYGLIDTMLENNGHSLNVKLFPDPSNRPAVSGGGLPGTYLLDAFHFHWGTTRDKGSEHLLHGCSFSGEMHFVHVKEEYGTVQEALKHPDGLAVIGVWLEESRFEPEVSSFSQDLISQGDCYFRPVGHGTNPRCNYTPQDHQTATQHWFTYLARMTTLPDDTVTPINLRQLLPFDPSIFYRYNGSLTTPPCTENVMWTVFRRPLLVSPFFFSSLRQLPAKNHNKEKLGHPTNTIGAEYHMVDYEDHLLSGHKYITNNFRPVQPLGDREVLFSYGQKEGNKIVCV